MTPIEAIARRIAEAAEAEHQADQADQAARVALAAGTNASIHEADRGS